MEAPARALASMTHVHVVFGLFIAVLIVVVIVYPKAAGLLVASQALPDGIAWFAAFDVASYLDAIALVWLLSATVRLRTVVQALRGAGAMAGRWIGRGIGAIQVRSRFGANRRARRIRSARRPPSKGAGGDWPAVACFVGCGRLWPPAVSVGGA